MDPVSNNERSSVRHNNDGLGARRRVLELRSGGHDDRALRRSFLPPAIQSAARTPLHRRIASLVHYARVALTSARVGVRVRRHYRHDVERDWHVLRLAHRSASLSVLYMGLPASSSTCSRSM